jgi:hypothetical protein
LACERLYSRIRNSGVIESEDLTGFPMGKNRTPSGKCLAGFSCMQDCDMTKIFGSESAEMGLRDRLYMSR